MRKDWEKVHSLPYSAFYSFTMLGSQRATGGHTMMMAITRMS
ncbi:MAG: hypothetical protein H6Q41_4935, partial [Deltaproteobacteria bacterium]|nr:hypothetical protein [Deltaproteobacteria bacterium]